jgi:hypothetical protein
VKFDETEPVRCRYCNHADYQHYSSDPGFIMSPMCRGTYNSGPKESVGCNCPGYEPL